MVSLQDHLKLLEDIAVLRPTIFCSVPRVYNKLYAGLVEVSFTAFVLFVNDKPYKHRTIHSLFALLQHHECYRVI